MNLKFFQPKATGKLPAGPSLSIRAKGQISINASATAALNAEPGEAATICFDDESEQYLLCHWPNGQTGFPVLRAQSGKATGLRFQITSLANELFAQTAYRNLTSVLCTIDVTPLTDEQAPGATLYALALPEGNAALASSGPAGVKQPGVGRGNYDRSTANRKGGSRG